MLSKVLTASLWGLEADLVTVETDLQQGMPALNLVGLADTTIKEAKERIRAAILNSGYEFPLRRITINLSPAGRPKEGSHFDLPIAMGILLLGNNQVVQAEETAMIGELSLDGRVKHIRGALPIAIGLRERGIKKLILPQKNMDEVSILSDMKFFPVENLTQTMELTRRPNAAAPYRRRKSGEPDIDTKSGDFSEVIGQESVKRALVVAAAGSHGILLMGNPGSGKTMMAKRIPSIMPEMSYEEKLEVTKIHSAAGLLSERHPEINQRPFRAPHHTISKVALVGGGQRPRPGEISLAHNGVLFLDEFGEFDRKLLELLRQPVEEEQIMITRLSGTVVFPSKFMLVAAANPCRCGYLGDETHICTCTENQIASYLGKFSGPLIDRIDLHVKVFPVFYQQLERKARGMSSAEMKKQVNQAREIQRERYRKNDLYFNSQLSGQEITRFCFLGKEQKALLKEAYHKLDLNMRTYGKIIKVARTIADLEASDKIDNVHITEALQYRALNQIYRRR